MRPPDPKAFASEASTRANAAPRKRHVAPPPNLQLGPPLSARPQASIPCPYSGARRCPSSIPHSR
eukprot:6206474-Pleurochrysis_carterae.AAC.1